MILKHDKVLYELLCKYWGHAAKPHFELLTLRYCDLDLSFTIPNIFSCVGLPSYEVSASTPIQQRRMEVKTIPAFVGTVHRLRCEQFSLEEIVLMKTLLWDMDYLVKLAYRLWNETFLFFLNVIIWVCEHYKQNPAHFHSIGLEAVSSETDSSKPGQKNYHMTKYHYR